MSDFLNLIHTRRSVRSFTAQPVADEVVHSIIACGHAAPSGGNLKAWRFIIIRDPEQKERVVKATYSRNNESNPPQDWLLSAPILIAVVYDLSVVAERYGRHGINSLVYLDCACAVQNMLLSAVFHGLASCFISGFREHEMGEALGLPPDHEAVALVPLGHAAQPGVKRPAPDPDALIHYERWGQQNR